ncbi:hypothetical protein JW879_02660 [candidate division WOR-3 bacterium]|nr:hypothetical protein [candidate division WOR-3 bacterium]
MYQNKYFVTKDSGTYSETLETYGLAKILSHIFDNNKIDNVNIKIKDEGAYYSVSSNINITEKMVKNTNYFVFPYIKIKTDKNRDLSGQIIYYENEKEKRDIFKKRRDEIYHKERDKNKQARLLAELEKPHPDFDIFSKIRDPKNITGYHKILNNVYKNRKQYHLILKEILLLYSLPLNNEENVKEDLKNLSKQYNLNFDKITALQIFNPHQGKGVNFPKSNSIALSNISSFWIKEYLKIIGIYNSMVIKDIKVSNKDWDTKYYVIEPFNIEYTRLSTIYKNFKPLVVGNKPFKMDIIAILYYTKNLIEFLPEYQNMRPSFSKRLNPQNLVQGFKTAYQKNMGQNKSIANIGYLKLPKFIEIGSYEEGKKWIKILNNHLEIMKQIKEENSSTTSLLQHYRQFLSAGNWDEFFEFNFDYASLLTEDIDRKKTDKRKMYLKTFTVKNLREVFMTEERFKPILESQGFQNIAKAIRNSTIGAQYAKVKGDKRFDVHYGVAQNLKRKSPYKRDLVEYLSEFIALYNAETARYVEKHPQDFTSGKVRATVKTEDMKDIIELIDKYGPSVVGKLLTAYGYALERKEEITKNSKIK